MKRHIISDALRSLVRPSTTKYPRRPFLPQDGYRGAAEYDPEKCVGCGACSQACPSGAITYSDGGKTRALKINYGICSFCGRCEEICPWDAIHLTKKFELAVFRKEDAETGVEVPLLECTECGRPFFPSPQMKASVEKIREILEGYRIDPDELTSLISICPTCSFSVDKMPERRMFMRRLVR
ncbi:MAG: 4Fe-4S binding protein [Candidatus Bathyarchaeia archaeon]